MELTQETGSDPSGGPVPNPSPPVRSGAIVDVGPAVSVILERRDRLPPHRAALVAVSGIDGSGKGYVTERLAEALRSRGLSVAVLHVDGWLNLPDVRFRRDSPALHFYGHAIRFEEMFDRVALPLARARRVDIEVDFAEETASAYRKRRYAFDDVDVVLLEGISLLRPAFLPHFDATVWIECSFETALDRAVARGQEGLSEAATVAAYQVIYFPAQRIHFALDRPWEAADVVLVNDPRLRDGDRPARIRGAGMF